MHRYWKFNLHGHAALLPFTIGYALFCFVVYGARSWGFKGGLLLCIASKPMIGRPGAQTIGAAQCYADSTQIARMDLRVHETVHVVQAMCGALIGQVLTPVLFAALGWPIEWGCILGGFCGAALYSLAYGLCFLVAWIAQGFGDWRNAYHAVFFEKQAYARQAAWLAMSKEQRAEVWS